MTTLLLLAALALFLTFVLPWMTLRLKSRTERLERAIDAMDASYNYAQSLLKDQSVLPALVSFIVWFQTRTGRPDLARKFTFDLIRGNVRVGGQVRTHKSHELLSAVDRLDSKQLESFGLMMASGMAACAYSDALFSKYHVNIWKAVMSEDVKREDHKPPSPEKIRTVVDELSPKYEKNADLCPA